MESLQKPLRGTRLFSDGYVCIINPRDQQVATSGLARQRKIEAGLPAFFARRNILEYEGLRAKIDFSKPQQAICHLLNSRVNNISATGNQCADGLFILIESRVMQWGES